MMFEGIFQLPPNVEEWRLRFALAVDLGRGGAWAPAYGLWHSLEASGLEGVALLYNLAICHIQAEQWPQALELADQALTTLKGWGEWENVAQDITYRELTSWDHVAYREPIALDLPRILPAYTEECLQRLLVDCCLQLQLWPRLRELLAQCGHRVHGNLILARQTLEQAAQEA